MISGGAGHRNRTYNDAKDRPQKTIQLVKELLISWRHSSMLPGKRLSPIKTNIPRAQP